MLHAASITLYMKVRAEGWKLAFSFLCGFDIILNSLHSWNTWPPFTFFFFFFDSIAKKNGSELFWGVGLVFLKLIIHCWPLFFTAFWGFGHWHSLFWALKKCGYLIRCRDTLFCACIQISWWFGFDLHVSCIKGIWLEPKVHFWLINGCQMLAVTFKSTKEEERQLLMYFPSTAWTIWHSTSASLHF